MSSAASGSADPPSRFALRRGRLLRRGRPANLPSRFRFRRRLRRTSRRGDGFSAVRTARVLFTRRLSALVVVCIGVCIGAAALVWLLGARNPYTPAGYVGYLTKGAVLGKSRFYGIQRGPTSAGRTWLLDVTNISITPYTYTEEFTGNQAVLSRDNLKISFAVHTVWSVDETRVPLLAPSENFRLPGATFVI